MLSLPSGEPQGKDGNQKIRDKCKQYLDRVEELQEYLVNKEVVTEIKYIIFVLQMLTWMIKSEYNMGQNCVDVLQIFQKYLKIKSQTIGR